MPTKVERPFADSTPTCSRDTPPHLKDNSVSKAVRFELVETLKAIEGPHDDVPEDAKIFDFETEELPGHFMPCHCVELEAYGERTIILINGVALTTMKFFVPYIAKKWNYSQSCSHLTSLREKRKRTQLCLRNQKLNFQAFPKYPLLRNSGRYPSLRPLPFLLSLVAPGWELW